MDKKQKYIKIALSDFSNYSSFRSKESYFRSLEKYLEKNSQPYESEGQTCIIYVDDKNDAIRIGLHFGLDKLKYFDGVNLLPLILDAKEKSPSAPKYMIFDNTGKKIGIRKLREQSMQEIKLNCIERSEVIKRKILTRSEVEKAFARGELSPTMFMNKCFIHRKELAKFIKK